MAGIGKQSGDGPEIFELSTISSILIVRVSSFIENFALSREKK